MKNILYDMFFLVIYEGNIQRGGGNIVLVNFMFQGM